MEEPEATFKVNNIDEVESIVDQLIEPNSRLPVEAIQAARRKREEITPHLIQLIEDATRDCRQGLDVEDNGHFFATYLLAEFQATEAWPAVLAAVSLPGEKPFELYEDAITEDFGHIFAALVGDHLDALHSIIDDPKVNVYVRWQAIEALLFLIRDGVLSRESVVERLTRHLELAIEQRDEVAEGIISRLDDLGAESALPMIEAAFKKQLVDMQMIGSFDTVRRNIVRGDEAFQKTMDGLRRPQDLIEHMSGWAAFQEDNEDESEVFVSNPLLFAEDILDDADYVSDNDSTFRNEGIKIGRNEKCPCGSGKKYKKCCGKV